MSNKAINAYEYRYDDRGRINKKILPGCEYIQYWYDNADRVIAMQDGTLRKDGKFRLYMYDKLGRMVVQLLYTNWNYNSTFFKDNCAVTAFTNNSGFLGTGYSMISQLASQPSNASLEIVNYYDSYDFNGKLFTSAMPANITVSDYQKQYSIGSLTGTVVYATNGEALGTINVYDQKGQVIRSVRKGLGGYVEDVNNVYTFTGATDNTTARVNVKYGSNFVAKTEYTYGYGKKTKMKLSVAHGSSTRACETEYNYSDIGRLTSKKRFYSGPNSSYSYCSYTYDVHGWLTSIYSGGFQEELYYADSVDNGPKYYNGNISAYKWKKRNGNDYHGYIFKYDGNNRLSEAAYGWGNNLSSAKNYFSEYVDEYDYNGNIKRLRRRGNTGHGFGYVDDLYMTYSGNKLTSVRDNAIHNAYDGANDFYTESKEKEYPLTYNNAGSLESDAGRNIAYIRYDYNNNPTLIVFKDGHETEYVYSASGEKLRVIHNTAVYNVSKRTIGTEVKGKLDPNQTLYSDTTDYLLGGALTLRNGRIDKYQFEEGYCQAIGVFDSQPMQLVFTIEDIEVDPDEVPMPIADNFEFYYYDRDHLGNIRQVTKDTGWSKGDVVQTMDYYPFGAEFCDKNTKNFVQNHKYNGKEFDHMHGLNTYDYGARQYNPILCRMDKIDRFCEKDYSHSPYTYCMGNPIRSIDVNGDSCIILLAPYGARDAGHMAIAIQNDKGEWCLYSKNGTPKGVHAFGPEGAPGTIYHNDRGEKKAKNISGLFNDDTINPSARKSNPNAPENAPEYTEGYMLPTTSEEDQKIQEGVMSYIDRDYSLIASNCAQTVQYGLFNAQLPMGKGMLPKAEIYPSIMKANPNGRRIVYYNTKTEKYYKYAK